MDILTSLAVVTLAALVHASFQLSVSVLTLLSGHAIGASRSKGRLLGLTTSFVAGAAIITVLLLAFLAFVLTKVFGNEPPTLAWTVTSGIMLAVGIAVWVFYYRRKKGTSLWIPRGTAQFLNDRTKATKSSAEAFSLGMASVVGELLFIGAPLLASAFVLTTLPALWQLVGIALYAIVSLLTLGSVWMLIGSGQKLSEIQQWRESNKYFLQFAAGSGLIILGIFLYVFVVMGNTAGGF